MRVGETLTIAGKQFRSRLFVGTGKYPDFATMEKALAASGTEMVTVAVRRVNLVACPFCLASGPVEHDREFVIAAWNTRLPLPGMKKKIVITEAS